MSFRWAAAAAVAVPGLRRHGRLVLLTGTLNRVMILELGRAGLAGRR
jgi:hypothetical protein